MLLPVIEELVTAWRADSSAPLARLPMPATVDVGVGRPADLDVVAPDGGVGDHLAAGPGFRRRAGRFPTCQDDPVDRQPKADQADESAKHARLLVCAIESAV